METDRQSWRNRGDLNLSEGSSILTPLQIRRQSIKLSQGKPNPKNVLFRQAFINGVYIANMTSLLILSWFSLIFKVGFKV